MVPFKTSTMRSGRSAARNSGGWVNRSPVSDLRRGRVAVLWNSWTNSRGPCHSELWAGESRRLVGHPSHVARAAEEERASRGKGSARRDGRDCWRWSMAKVPSAGEDHGDVVLVAG